jgi:hypothetical protein
MRRLDRPIPCRSPFQMASLSSGSGVSLRCYFASAITRDNVNLIYQPLEMRPFNNYTQRFIKKFFFSAYAAFGFISMLLTYIPLPHSLHTFIPYLVVALFLASAYHAAWGLYKQNETKVVALQSQLEVERAKSRSELEQARKKPYDEDQRNLITGKIAKVTARERDLLRLLLSRGPTDSRMIQSLWVGEKYDTDQLLNVLKSAGLTTVEVEQTLNAARTNAIWEVSATCADVLKDLLYPRREDDAEPYFKF